MEEIQESYSRMDPRFNEIFLKMLTGNFIDVYPNPEHENSKEVTLMNSIHSSLLALFMMALLATRRHSLMNWGMGLIYILWAIPSISSIVQALFMNYRSLPLSMKNYLLTM